MRVANKSLENVAKVRCVAPPLADRNVVQEELQALLASGKVC
jgi:hypothetical protein